MEMYETKVYDRNDNLINLVTSHEYGVAMNAHKRLVDDCEGDLWGDNDVHGLNIFYKVGENDLDLHTTIAHPLRRETNFRIITTAVTGDES